VAAIGGAPQVFGNDPDKVDSQNELIQAIKNIPAEKLPPEANPVVAAVVRVPNSETGGARQWLR
jgi:hypothetical protein